MQTIREAGSSLEARAWRRGIAAHVLSRGSTPKRGHGLQIGMARRSKGAGGHQGGGHSNEQSGFSRPHIIGAFQDRSRHRPRH